jgi:heme/copper-type cytochrome/quinol oxidase subunit 1
MLWVLGGFAIFVLGGLTGVMVALAPFDFQAHDSFFIVGHLHYVLVGGAIFPIIAGVYYFYPIIGGKLLSERLGTIGFWLAFIGFNVAFLPMHLSGMRGMPRRVFTYAPGLGLDTLNLVSTVGAFILATGLFVVLWDAHSALCRLRALPGAVCEIPAAHRLDRRALSWAHLRRIRGVGRGRVRTDARHCGAGCRRRGYSRGRRQRAQFPSQGPARRAALKSVSVTPKPSWPSSLWVRPAS